MQKTTCPLLACSFWLKPCMWQEKALTAPMCSQTLSSSPKKGGFMSVVQHGFIYLNLRLCSGHNWCLITSDNNILVKQNFTIDLKGAYFYKQKKFLRKKRL